MPSELMTDGTIDGNHRRGVLNHRRRPDGMVEIDIDDTTQARINQLRRPGETDSDVVSRILAARYRRRRR